jgi:hypothetical protein
MCKGIKYLSSLFSDPLPRHTLVIDIVKVSNERDIVANHFDRPRASFLPNYLRIIFQVHYCSNPYNLFLKNISLKLKSSLTFDRKALRPCKGHFWTVDICRNIRKSHFHNWLLLNRHFRHVNICLPSLKILAKVNIKLPIEI